MLLIAELRVAKNDTRPEVDLGFLGEGRPTPSLSSLLAGRIPDS